MALKARVLTYAASDLHESSKAPAGYGGDLHAYTGGQQARWQAAQQASKAVLDMTSMLNAFTEFILKISIFIIDV